MDSETGLTWIKDDDTDGYFTLRPFTNPQLALTATSTDSLTIENRDPNKNNQKWKLTDTTLSNVFKIRWKTY